MKKLAIFDIDGTLFRWQLFFSLVFELQLRGVFDEETSTAIDENFRNWQGRQSDWRTFSEVVVEALLSNLHSIDTTIYRQAVDSAIEKEGHKVYNYTLSLSKRLKSEGYTLLAITGSMQEMAEKFADKYGFDYCIGTTYQQIDGKFTGAVKTIWSRKDEVLREFLSEHPEHTLEGSVAIGDSHSDAKLLRAVERPIAFNPDEGLLDEAVEKGWEIVIERKNIAYSLKKDEHGSVVLAKTDRY